MEPRQNSVYSASPVGCPSKWSSTVSEMHRSSHSGSLNLNVDSPRHHFHHAKQMGLQLQDQGSSSTQSTGQSNHEIGFIGPGNSHVQYISGQSGFDETVGRQANEQMKSVLSLAAPDFVFPFPKADHPQSVASSIPYAFVDPSGIGGALAAYGPQVAIHSHMMGMASARVPLPLEFSEDQPIYVNAKQYRAILRRREARAKLEAQNKLVKARKPYLHESRHLHAMKRARGSGGRFLNKKKLEQSDFGPGTKGDDVLQLRGNPLHPESFLSDSNAGASATSSVITSISINDIFFQKGNTGLSNFHSYMSKNLQCEDGAAVHAGNQHRVSVIQ